MENQKMPEYETIRAAVAGEKWAVEKVVECYKDEIDRLSTVAVRQPEDVYKRQVPQRGKLVIFPRCVYTVVNGNVAHFVFGENNLYQLSLIHIFSAYPGILCG